MYSEIKLCFNSLHILGDNSFSWTTFFLTIVFANYVFVDIKTEIDEFLFPNVVYFLYKVIICPGLPATVLINVCCSG